MTYVIRTIAVMVGRETDDLFSEMVTRVEVVNEGAGEFVTVSQNGRDDVGKISIGPEEWPELCRAIGTMIATCRREDGR